MIPSTMLLEVPQLALIVWLAWRVNVVEKRQQAFADILVRVENMLNIPVEAILGSIKLDEVEKSNIQSTGNLT